MTGFINIIKPPFIGSTKVVTAVKRKFSVPCGHMGTLDPMASGVLPVGIGKTTRLFPYMLEKEKVYVAEFTFGYLTDTLDVTGTTEKETGVIPTKEQIEKVLPEFVGEIMQIPPKYSAKCVNGKKGYDLARRGIEFELAPKKVNIESITLLEETKKNVFSFEIVCGGGTYIRSIARDLGEKCGSLAVMSALERTKSGAFNMENGVDLEEFVSSSEPEKYIIPADFAVNFDKLILTPYQSKKILDGVYENYGFKDGIYRVYNQTDFWGIGEVNNGILKIKSYVR